MGNSNIGMISFISVSFTQDANGSSRNLHNTKNLFHLHFTPNLNLNFMLIQLKYITFNSQRSSGGARLFPVVPNDRTRINQTPIPPQHEGEFISMEVAEPREGMGSPNPTWMHPCAPCFLRRSPSQPQLFQNFEILLLTWLFLELLFPPHGAPTSLIKEFCRSSRGFPADYYLQPDLAVKGCLPGSCPGDCQGWRNPEHVEPRA